MASNNERDEVTELQEANNNQVVLSLEEGMVFADAFEMKDAVVNYAIAIGADIIWKRTGHSKMTAVCRRCGWRVYGTLTKNKQSFVIKKLVGPHSCDRVNHNKQATSKWIAREFLDRFRVNPKWGVREMMAELKEKFDLQVHPRTCYRARKEAIKLLEENTLQIETNQPPPPPLPTAQWIEPTKLLQPPQQQGRPVELESQYPTWQTAEQASRTLLRERPTEP